MRRKGSSSIRRRSFYAAILREHAEAEETVVVRSTVLSAPQEALDDRDPVEMARYADAALKGQMLA